MELVGFNAIKFLHYKLNINIFVISVVTTLWRSSLKKIFFKLIINGTEASSDMKTSETSLFVVLH